MKSLIARLFSLAAANFRPFIVGGSDVSIEDFPYQIALLYGGYRNCGGSIISPNHIVTAAHCVAPARPDELSIRAGSSSSSSGGTVVNVSSIAMHPQYYAPTVDNDIAVLTLAESLTYGPGIAPVGLPLSGSALLSTGENVVVSGWGSIREAGPSSRILQAVTVSVVSMEECKESYRDYGDITDSMFCAGVPEGGKDACGGDSGGPVVADGVLIGVVSWGHGCARKGFPGVYSSTAFLRDFIAQMTGI
ncbi:trypsin-like serine protease [Aspergillus californicus]